MFFFSVLTDNDEHSRILDPRIRTKMSRIRNTAGMNRDRALAAVSVLPSRTKVTKVRTEMRTGVVAHRYTHSASRYFLPNHNYPGYIWYFIYFIISSLKHTGT
jgi:hypothetical protein